MEIFVIQVTCVHYDITQVSIAPFYCSSRTQAQEYIDRFYTRDDFLCRIIGLNELPLFNL